MYMYTVQYKLFNFNLSYSGHYVDHLLGHIKAIDADIGDNAKVN